MTACAPGWHDPVTRSRIIGWLRLLLPLIALGLLSTMFLFSERPAGESKIPFSQNDLERQAGRPGIVAPELATVTGDGTELTLRAGHAGQTAGSGGTLSGLRLDMYRKDGLDAVLTAPDAEITGKNVTLSGGVTMDMSNGWSISSRIINVATDRLWLNTGGGIEAAAPFGEISADALELTYTPANDSAVLNFTGGVRLIYYP